MGGKRRLGDLAGFESLEKVVRVRPNVEWLHENFLGRSNRGDWKAAGAPATQRKALRDRHNPLDY